MLITSHKYVQSDYIMQPALVGIRNKVIDVAENVDDIRGNNAQTSKFRVSTNRRPLKLESNKSHP